MESEAIAKAARIMGPIAKRDVPIGPLTTYRVGGNATLLAAAEHEGQLDIVRDAAHASGLPVLVLGRGSNMLVSDRGFAGIVVTLTGTFGEIIIDENWVRAGAAVSLPVLARKTAAAGLTGLEWAVGVPGSVGGAVRMNAGGHGSETAERLRRCRLADLDGFSGGTLDVRELGLTYRGSSISASRVVVWAEFELSPGDPEASNAKISEIVKWRREHQPGGHNAGSVFVNPPGDSAGRLIDEAGLRGFRIGSASVSAKHANFIQSDVGGTASDVMAVMRHVHHVIKETHDIALRTEIRLIGFRDEEREGLTQ